MASSQKMKIGFSLGAKRPKIVSSSIKGFSRNDTSGATEESTKTMVMGFSATGDLQVKQPPAGSRSTNGELIIPLISKNKYQNVSETKSEESEEEKQPLLTHNQIPGLAALESESEKFQHDVAHRPDALDVTSDSYDQVPVENFGLAMLRGMGWNGTRACASSDPVPRVRRLGLGAKPRPMESSKKRKHHSKDKKKKKKKKYEE